MALPVGFTKSSHDALWQFHLGPYANASLATQVVSEWQHGSYLLEVCTPRNCSIVCVDPLSWYTNFFTCSVFPTFAKAVRDGILSEDETAALGAEGITGDESTSLRIALTVQACLQDFCQFSPGCSDSPGAGSCTSDFSSSESLKADWNKVGDAFTSYIGNGTGLDMNTTADCLNNAICNFTPPANPDITGIGIFISYALQSSLAIIILCAIAFFDNKNISDPTPAVAEKKRLNRKGHFDALISTLVEFHKAQCYFASAVSIAALYFMTQAFANSDWLDADTLEFVCTIGLLPPVFTLAGLAHYGQSSWYLTGLTLVTFILSSTIIGRLRNLWSVVDFLPKPSTTPVVFPSCGWSTGLSDPFLQTPSTLCPSVDDGFLERLRNADFFIWACWPVAIIWLLFLILGQATKKPWYHKIWEMPEHADQPRNRWLEYVYLASWLAMFMIQFYLLALFYHFVGQGWGFGQIVAVTVWVPCLVEFGYLEYNGMKKGSEYRLAKTLTVVNKSAVALQPGPAGSSHDLANLASPADEPRNISQRASTLPISTSADESWSPVGRNATWSA